MNSKIFIGEIYHSRRQPVPHKFRYPIYCYAFDLAELQELDRRLPLFGYNRWRPVSLFDRDYLKDGCESLAAKVMTVLRERGLGQEVAKIYLVTTARYLGYAFNPVSFYYCYDQQHQLRWVVAEVNNTFGERQLYVLDEPAAPVKGFAAHFRVPKAFYVSPFNKVEGDYDFRFADLDDRLDAQIRIFEGDEAVFHSWIRGRAVTLNSRNLLATLFRFPVNAALTVPRIHLQAARLFFQKKLPITIKPGPFHPDVVRVKPSPIQQQALAFFEKLFGRIRHGHLAMQLPDGSQLEFGSPGQAPAAALRVNNYDFFLRLALGGDVALGETYTRKDWDTEDITGVLKVFIANRELIADEKLLVSKAGKWVNRLYHLARDNTPGMARANIAAHYDLGNELFTSFLDPSLTYSCPIFESPHEDLETAQQRKLRTILEKARVRPEHHLLEIGCGWGSFAMLAAREVGCRVTGITLSQQQLELGRRRVREEGLEELVTLRLQDYRELHGQFDRIVSIEMLEAVGAPHLGTYFAAVDRLLAEDGLAVIQVITTPDHRYETYRRSCDWIQKVIFPGSHCPSLTALSQAMARHSTLQIEHAENIGIHYAAALARWRSRFNENFDSLREHGYDEAFYRTWNYYFSYCEAGFATRILGDLQLVLTRLSNRSLPGAHL